MKNDEMTADRAAETMDRLSDIQEEMRELLDEARQLVRGTPEQARAKAYWLAQIAMALDDDHGYLGSGSHTLQDTINYFDGAQDEC